MRAHEAGQKKVVVDAPAVGVEGGGTGGRRWKKAMEGGFCRTRVMKSKTDSRDGGREDRPLGEAERGPTEAHSLAQVHGAATPRKMLLLASPRHGRRKEH